MTIRTKLSLLVAGHAFILLVVAGSLQLFFERRHLSAERRAETEMTLKRLAEEAVISGDYSLLLASARDLKDRGRAHAVYIVDADGKVLFYNKAAGTAGVPAKPMKLGEKWTAAALAQRKRAETTTAQDGLRLLRTAVPLKAHAAERATALRVDFDRAADAKGGARLAGAARRRFLWASLISLTIGLVGASWVATSFTHTLHKLMSGAQEIGAGHLTAKVLTRRQDELGELSAEFNTMGRRLAELDELKDSFLAKITHDLRNPLSAVICYADLLEMQGPLNEKQKKSLRQVTESGNYLTELINNILDLTKMEAGRMEFDPVPTCLSGTVAGVVDLLKGRADRIGVALSASEIPREVTVFADAQALRRVLVNLVSNALKFTPESGAVSVAWSRTPGGEDRISIKDTGIGIPADKRHMLFTRFSQIGETKDRVRREAGTGLGLVICKEIVERHGGRIWVESEYKKGSTFHFSLPRRDASPLKAV